MSTCAVVAMFNKYDFKKCSTHFAPLFIYIYTYTHKCINILHMDAHLGTYVQRRIEKHGCLFVAVWADAIERRRVIM